jgi:hypothetical protein
MSEAKSQSDIQKKENMKNIIFDLSERIFLPASNAGKRFS